MKNLFTIEGSPENKIAFYHLAAFIILLPFDRFYSELILISLLLHSLIHINRLRARSILSFQNLVLCSMFLLTLAGMIGSADKAQAMRDLQRQLAILLFPVIFSVLDPDLRRYRAKLLTILAVTCIITILYLYADATRVLLYYKLPLRSLFSPAFINHNFSEPIGLHATYFSMYIALSLAVLFYFLWQEKNNTYRFLYLTGICILLAGLVQLASRSVLVTTMILIIPGVSFFMLRGGQRVRFAGVWLIVLGIAVLGIAKMDSFRKRYVENLKNDLTQASINNEVLEPRIIRWHYVIKLIDQSPVFGHGSGSEKRLLKEIYFENRLYNSYLHELNAHNQYLSILLKTGISGLAVFILTLFYGFVNAWRRKDIILAAFMVLISVVSFSENILDVNKGIFFYAFFFGSLTGGLKSRRASTHKPVA
ncbi:MAG TPA: O-antigen ligase family protein [Chitinophagaceae bacterium]|jgi:O-antigen ligase|nr:O-antigen ligase family protein [Chitinophagaceae bacterium]